MEEVLRRTAHDLTSTRKSLLEAKTEINRLEKEVSQLELHVAAIKADNRRYRDQSVDRAC